MSTSFHVGVDIGGTFTDVVVRDDRGLIRFFKTPTTRKDESVAVINAIARMGKDWQIAPSRIMSFAHGTTVGTNSVLERRGERIGLIMTKGFKDVLEIGRQFRHNLYSAILEPETPTFLAPGEMRREVCERIAHDGSVLIPLVEDEVLSAAGELVAAGAKAIAICFLFSFANSTHEVRARELIQAAFPKLIVSLSHEVDPAFREYERTVVTAFDAYLKSIIDRYLSRLEGGLESSGIAAPLQVMQSRGGLMASSVARRRPVRLFLSGPAAGVIGAQHTALKAGFNNLVTVDVGGTSCDIALVSSGKALIRPEGYVAGYSIRVPMIDVNSIGAGGGSIATIDAGGGLRVGPLSAGSEPGPACYDRGGERPTVTDASVVLGYIDPSYFAGGALRLVPALAREAIRVYVAEPLGLSVEDAALGIHRVVNAQISEGIRLVSVKRGIDPRGFVLLPLGGGGGIHATSLAEELGLKKVVVPRRPGVLSALGLLAAPIEHEVSRAFGRDLEGLSLSSIHTVLGELDAACTMLMREERAGDKPIDRLHFADVCYVGQSFTIEVPIDLTATELLKQIYTDFLDQHLLVYGHRSNAPARIVNLRAVHRIAAPALDFEEVQPDSGREEFATGFRNVRIAGVDAPIQASIYRRDLLPRGFRFSGPAILEQSDTTTLVHPGWTGEVDGAGNLILTKS
jgi:N-methylhydantoinase A